jgi:peptidoglycan-N-acetylglucosamine deacetylase
MVGLWPERVRAGVMLTFDVDGPSGALNRDPSLANNPSLVSMGEFGPEVGLPRILDLLADQGIAATFFVPGWVAERWPEQVSRIARAGHEIAHHGYLHEPPGTLASRAEEAAVLDRASAILEKITGAAPRGYRSPSWELSPHSLELLMERGFAYDSSLMGNDVPYLARVGDAGEASIVEIPVHWSLDDVPYYPWSPVQGRLSALSSPADVLQAWEWEFDGAYREGGAFILTMHPYVSGRHSRLEALRRLVQYIKSCEGVEFYRCIDVADSWSAEGMRPA